MTVGIIGGGILGLSVAHELIRRDPGIRVILVEKEPELASHQTGHNSGVIHSGIYYRPSSSKARTCVAGGTLLRRFCDEHGIRYEQCGKIVVARTADELPMLQELYRRGQANGVPSLRLIGGPEIKEIEPAAAGVAALHVPTAAILNYRDVCAALAARITEAGAEIRLSCRVLRITSCGRSTVLETTGGDVEVSRYIACAGLHSDRVARMSPRADVPDFRIVPFRGEYYDVSRPELVRGLIYPVPDPRFPFLGVHFTRTIDGGLEAGPNAVLAFAREGYRKTDVNLRDIIDTLSYSGFWKLARRHWRTGVGEIYRSLSKRAFARALATLVPEITPEDLIPAAAGVRAQALAGDGMLHDDFVIASDESSLHVCNAPSPAATAALAIAKEIADRF